MITWNRSTCHWIDSTSWFSQGTSHKTCLFLISNIYDKALEAETRVFLFGLRLFSTRWNDFLWLEGDS